MVDGFDISRRKLLGTVGVLGTAGAIGGSGTLAFFSDEEEFANNQLTAGSLDMKVAYEASYSDWSPDEGDGVEVTMWDGAPGTTGGPGDLPPGTVGLPANDAWLVAVDNPNQFLDNTQYQADGLNMCPDGTDAQDVEQPVIDLDDVKPGDFGEVTFSFQLCDNPGFVWLQGDLRSCSENGVTEPEAADDQEDGDEASLLPLAAAGGTSAASLTDVDVREKVGEALGSDDSDEGIVDRKDALRAATAGATGAAGLGALSGAASAAPGDLLGTVTLSNSGNCSVAGTWDGTYYTTVDNSLNCASDILQISEPPASGNGAATLVAEKNVVDSNGDPVEISAVEWDPTRSKYWGAYDGTTYLINRGDPTDGTEDAVVEDSFDTSDPHGFGIVDGLAIDDDDSLWYSPDVDTQVVKYDLSSGNRGDILRDIEPKDQNGDVAGSISGVAVGASMNGRETLYVGQNPGPADGNIIRVYADNGEYISNFATGTDFRVEDITCAPALYDTEALLVKDSDVGEYKAFEVEEGTCPLSGGGDEGDDDGDCANVELLDVVRAAYWVDNGNNYQDGDEEPTTGTLREVLADLSSGVGAPLAGDIPAEEGGGSADARNCFSATDEEHSVAFAWWVPVDHGNEIQTDQVSFDLGFYTEQCRHNTGEGMANDGGGQQLQCRPGDGFAKLQPELSGQTSWHARSIIADNDAGTVEAGNAELDIRDPGDADLAEAGASYPSDGTAVPWTLTYSGGTAELTVDGQSVSTAGPEPTTGAVGITAKARQSGASITVADVEYNGVPAGCDVSASGEGDTQHVVLEGTEFRDGDTLSGTVAYDADGASGEELGFRVDV